MIRSIDDWKEILAPILAKDETKIVKAILGDIVHYYHGRPHENDDEVQLLNAMEAYHQIRSVK